MKRQAAEPLSRLQVAVLVAGAALAVASGRASYRIEGRYGTNPGPDPCTYRQYDRSTGQLSTMLCDQNLNGVTDTWISLEPNGAHTIQFDPDEDGPIDRVEEYGADQQLHTISSSPRPDGSFERVEHFGAGGRARPNPAPAAGPPVPPKPEGN